MKCILLLNLNCFQIIIEIEIFILMFVKPILLFMVGEYHSEKPEASKKLLIFACVTHCHTYRHTEGPYGMKFAYINIILIICHHWSALVIAYKSPITPRPRPLYYRQGYALGASRPPEA